MNSFFIISTVLKCRNETHKVIKYLEFCVHKLRNAYPGVHNLLHLYMQSMLIGFLAIADHNNVQPPLFSLSLYFYRFPMFFMNLHLMHWLYCTHEILF